MKKQRLIEDIENEIVFGDSQLARDLNASMKEGKVVILNQNSCAVYYRNHSLVCRLKDVQIKRDKSGYYVLI